MKRSAGAKKGDTKPKPGAGVRPQAKAKAEPKGKRDQNKEATKERILAAARRLTDDPPRATAAVLLNYVPNCSHESGLDALTQSLAAASALGSGCLRDLQRYRHRRPVTLA